MLRWLLGFLSTQHQPKCRRVFSFENVNFRSMHHHGRVAIYFLSCEKCATSFLRENDAPRHVHAHLAGNGPRRNSNAEDEPQVKGHPGAGADRKRLPHRPGAVHQRGGAASEESAGKPWLSQRYLTCLHDNRLTLVSCQVVDVDRMFTNMETVCEVSAALLHRLHEAIAELDKEAVVIGNGVHPPATPARPVIPLSSLRLISIWRGNIHPG